MKLLIQSKVMHVAALVLMALPLHSGASSVATAAINITARYQQACVISAVPVLDFGTITSNTSDVTVVGTMVVSCTDGSSTPFGVWAPMSTNASGTQRRMKNNNSSAGNYLNYTLQMVDASGGSTTLPSATTSTGYTSPSGVSSTGDEPFGIVLRGTLPAGQTLTQGYYVDDLVLTVSY